MWNYPHTVTFQQYVEVSDGGGGYTKDWEDIFTTQAHVQPVSSKEIVQAQQVDAPINHKIFYPYQEGVKENMRAQYNGKTLELKSNPLDQGGLGEVMMVMARG